MPYPNKFYKVILHGTMYGSEIWQMGFNLGKVGADAFTDGNDWAGMLDAFKNDLWADTTTGGRLISNNYQLVGIKASLIGLNGKVEGDPTYIDYPTPVNGAGSGYTPPQIAVVISTSSDTSRGIATKGRMYLPGFANNVGPTGHLSSSDMGYLATRVQTWLNDTNGASLNNRIIHTSMGSKKPGSVPVPTARLVTGFNIGDVLDTQRRRRNAFVEVRTGRTITTT